mmetsp:Transcript_33060/g.92012  ORF Transcript_33060/g.92012 Transcript_33060/m.92012 type:complete len:225 (-) Transcript_33060:507-1181(-)
MVCHRASMCAHAASNVMHLPELSRAGLDPIDDVLYGLLGLRDLFRQELDAHGLRVAGVAPQQLAMERALVELERFVLSLREVVEPLGSGRIRDLVGRAVEDEQGRLHLPHPRLHPLRELEGDLLGRGEPRLQAAHAQRVRRAELRPLLGHPEVEARDVLARGDGPGQLPRTEQPPEGLLHDPMRLDLVGDIQHRGDEHEAVEVGRPLHAQASREPAAERVPRRE